MKKLAILISLILSAVSAVPAQATAPEDTLTLTGFEKMKSGLSQTQKDQITTFIDAHPAIDSIICTGYTGHNYLGKSKSTLKKLARARATKACQFAVTAAGISSYTIHYKLTNSKKNNSRKVKLEIVAPTAGYYTYQFPTFDTGSGLHNGAPSTVSHSGDIVASTFADGTTLDPSIDPYGLGGNVNGGAVYFAFWNTAPDDSGTRYFLGSQLPDPGAGNHVTLYAIFMGG